MSIWANIKKVFKGIFTPTCYNCSGVNDVKMYTIKKQGFYFCNKVQCQKRLNYIRKLS